MNSNGYAHSSFDDIVFEEKNKAYGAYRLRRLYVRDIGLALLLGLIVLAGIIYGPDIYKKLFPHKKHAAKAKFNTDSTMVLTTTVKKTPKKAPPPPKMPPVQVEQIKYLPIKVTPDDLARQDTIDQDLFKSKANVGPVSHDGAHDHITEVVVTDIGDDGTEDNEVYTVVQEKPTFKGGEQKYYEYLDANFVYPPKAIDDEIEGVVWVFFVVEKNGSITDVKIIPGQGLSKECDAEAIRVVKSMPNWIPGKNNGVAVRTKHKLGITFVLE